MKALNKKNQMLLAENVEVASTLYMRMKGLMGRKKFTAGQGMLIKRSGNSIHTFFMHFPIDLVFLDKTGKVCWVRESVNPWHVVVAPLFVSTDCLELPAGTVKLTQTQVGDFVYVEN